MSQERIEEKERREAEKYDRRAEQILQNESKGELHVDDIHWTKIRDAKWPYDPYAASIRALGDLRGKRVLELGCGTGWLTVILCKLGATVDGVDISDEQVKIAGECVDGPPCGRFLFPVPTRVADGRILVRCPAEMPE